MADSFVKKLMEIAANAKPLPDWHPAVRTQCTCGHSWLFHWLAEPHKCNDCKTCPGYVPSGGES